MATKNFTATNGYTLQNNGGLLRIKDDLGKNTLRSYDFLNNEDTRALREFFRHERDEELGRWRWPERSDYLVYPVGEGVVDVIRESNISDITLGPGRQQGITRDSAYNWDKAYSKTFYNAARAYFDAHPLRKPWHDAKPGEVWVLKTEGVDERWNPTAFTVTDGGSKFVPVEPGYSISHLGRMATAIIDAHRI